jgi:hypothetical protein
MLREMFVAVGVWGLALIAIAIALAIAIYDISQKPAAARTRSRAGGRRPEPNRFVATSRPGVPTGIRSTAQETSHD